MDLHIMVILLSLYGVSTLGVVNDYVPHIYNSQQRCDNTESIGYCSQIYLTASPQMTNDVLTDST